MGSKISVITVVYNDVASIRHTMESFFSQTWEDKELIVIDGGSTDGTAEIIEEYAPRLAYWCSEKDDGIYDAMNKGVRHASGDWINILNCGDYYASDDVLEKVVTTAGIYEYDVIYGNSVEVSENTVQQKIASPNVQLLRRKPIYRHGSSFVKASVHKDNLFDLSEAPRLGYALDWEQIHRLYAKGYKFKKIDATIECYLLDGISNQRHKSALYNYRILKRTEGRAFALAQLAKDAVQIAKANSRAAKWMRAFVLEYLVNDILPHVPFWAIRKAVLARLGTKIGKKSFVAKRNYLTNANHIKIGDYTHINRGCLLDARGYITIGNNVSISHEVKLVTGSHDLDSTNFHGVYLPIVIGDYAWIGINATILNGTTIGEGAVVCAGAVVTKDVEPYSVVAGVPARVIRHRSRNLNYHCIWDMPFT